MKRRYKKLDLFSIVNTTILLLLALSCLMPILNVLAISLSEQGAVAAGKVGLWPVNFTLAAYKYVIKDAAFFKSMLISTARVFIGPVLNLVLAILCAYPLSKPESRFHARNIYVWLFYFTTLFFLFLCFHVQQLLLKCIFQIIAYTNPKEKQGV